MSSVAPQDDLTMQPNPLETTLKKLAEDTGPVSVASLYTLSGLDPDDVQQVRSAWPMIPVDRRESAMRHLVEIAEENFEVDFNSIYRLGLTDQDPEVRSTAIDGLWEDNDPALIELLIRFMQSDTAESVRAAAAGALGRYVLAGELEEIPAAKIEPVTAALRATLLKTDESIEVRRRALEALGFLGADEAAELIDQSYKDPNERMRVSAVFAMGRSADAQWGEVVIGELNSANPEMRFEAARASGELEYAPALPGLSNLIDDVDDEVQKAALWALGEIGGDTARRRLIKVLDSDAGYLHEVAEEALDELEFKTGNLDFSLLEVGEDDGDSWALDLADEDDTALDD